MPLAETGRFAGRRTAQRCDWNADLQGARSPGGDVWIQERSYRMSTLARGVTRFLREEDGVTAIEYGLIAALIAVVIIVSVGTVGNQLKNVFTFIANSLGNAMS
jgi:pilus assembly protein Flp/PilA